MEKFDKELFGGTTVVSLKGKKLSDKNWKGEELYDTQKPIYEDIVLKAIPYCYWGNRKPGEMSVWLKSII